MDNTFDVSKIKKQIYDSLPTVILKQLPNEPSRHQIQTAAVLTTTFYATRLGVQRISGLMGMHSGRFHLLMPLFALCSTAFSCVLTREVSYDAERFVNARIEEKIPSWKSKKQPLLLKNKSYFEDDLLHVSKNENFTDCLKRDIITLFAFIALEGKFFLTAIPSSVIDIGVFANPWAKHFDFLNVLKGSERSNDPIANENQRKLIQGLGKRLGCHHCGSRQRMTRESFIADHMQPTKMENAIKAQWWFSWNAWQKLFKATQHLYPQCRSCFSKQGSAVRANKHVVIYHNKFKFFYLAPAIGYMYSESQAKADEFLTPTLWIPLQSAYESNEKVRKFVSEPIQYVWKHKYVKPLSDPVNKMYTDVQTQMRKMYTDTVKGIKDWIKE